MNRPLGALPLSVALAFAGTAGATEFGQSHADLGYIDTLAGLPLAPGFYLRDDINIVTSGRLNNGNGDPVNLNLGRHADRDEVPQHDRGRHPVGRLRAGLQGPVHQCHDRRCRVSRRSPTPAPVSTTGLGIPQARATSKAGFGDMTVVPIFLGFDVPNTDFHFVFSPLEFTAPIGRYDKNDPIGNNIGLNYWSYRPALEFTYLNKTGQEFSLNMSASINTQNQATHYRSGDEFYFTYAFQQYLSPRLAFGIGGYYYKQAGNDTLNGQVVNTTPRHSTIAGAGPGNKGETFAIGPIVSYNYSHD